MNDAFKNELKNHGIIIEDDIGTGAFGTVYSPVRRGVKVAVKVSHQRMSDDGRLGDEKKQLQIDLQKVNAHPHLLTLHDVLPVQGCLVTVWDRADGDLSVAVGIPRAQLCTYFVEAANCQGPSVPKREWNLPQRY
jgi:hypothetical protein